ncbi:MAG: hypothetical protein LBC07_05775 [Elusimicrobiota bacterium]|nr:hypothetical protein [Elusimicrobiota bacterium]
MAKTLLLLIISLSKLEILFYAVDFIGREFEIDLEREGLAQKLFEQNLEKLKCQEILNALKFGYLQAGNLILLHIGLTINFCAKLPTGKIIWLNFVKTSKYTNIQNIIANIFPLRIVLNFFNILFIILFTP